MSDVIVIDDECKPSVVVVGIEGIQAPAADREPFATDPTALYKAAKEKAEALPDTTEAPDASDPVGGITMDGQMDRFAKTVGHDVGTNVANIKKAQEIADETVLLCEEATTSANEAIEKANGANTKATEAHERSAQALTNSNAALESAKTATEAATGAKGSALASAQAAAESAAQAQESATIAASALDGVNKAKTDAQSFKDLAETAAADSANAAMAAQTFAESASGYAETVQGLIGSLRGLCREIAFKRLAVSVDGQQDAREFVRFDTKATIVENVRVNIARCSEWSDGDVSRVTCEYDGVTADGVTLIIRNKGTGSINARFAIQVTELIS